MKQKTKNILNHTSLWIQLASLIIMMITIIAFILIYNNYTSVRNQSIQNQINLSSKLLHMESESLDQYIAELANFCIQPYYDSEFTRILNQKSPLTTKQLSYVRQQMYYYYYTRNDLLEYELYLVNQDTAIGRTKHQQHMTIQQTPTFDVKHVLTACAESTKHHYIEPANAPAFFTYYHSLFQIKGKKEQCIVRLELDTSAFMKQFNSNHASENEIVAFLDENSQLIYSNHKEILPDNSTISEVLSTTKHHRNNYDTVKVNGTEYLLIMTESDKTHLQLMCFTPVSNIDAQFDSISTYIILSGLCVWFFAIVLVYMMLRFLTTPLKKLAAQMQRTGHGDFQTTLNVSGSVEITELSKNFNDMVTQIDQLIQRTYVAELSEKNAKLTALEAQINPHFLYNTLQAISTEALVNDQTQIYKMITALASNLRYTIKGRDMVTLKQEMEYVTNYIFLQKMRMDDDLTFTQDIDSSAEVYLIPKISIQALVENSIIHGKNKDTGKIAIHVEVHCVTDQIIIRVRDNGCGIPAEQLERMKTDFPKLLENGARDSIGLANLYIRLQLLYEAPALMEIHSKENLYTEITLTLPAIKEVPHVQSSDY